MHHLELNEEQHALLRATLDSTVRDLSYEIASADLPSFRQLLRRRREVLRQVLDAVGGPIPRASASA
jgi:hypothetical protein